MNSPSGQPYVHGYSGRENLRLKDQAQTLDDLIHNDSLFPEGSLVLEAGCGVGAQTRIIARKNPGARFVSVDLSGKSIQEAQKLIRESGICNVTFQQADLFHLPFEEETFDHIFVCFVLEHLPDPGLALIKLKKVLKRGGSLMTIEGDHGSAFFHPDSQYARQAIECQIKLQQRSGGNSNIGRALYPLLKAAGFSNVSVSPRMVYVDAGKPQWVEGFIKNTFTAMIEGIRENALKECLTDPSGFEKGIRDLYRTAEPDGVFCYTFFKGFGMKA